MKIKEYRKGISRESWNDFFKAVQTGDTFGISCSGSKPEGKERLPVDAYVFATRVSAEHLAIWEGSQKDPRPIGSPEHLEAIKQLHFIAKYRDKTFKEVPASFPSSIGGAVFPKGLTRLSWFLRSWEQNRFVPGRDYLTTAEEFNRVYDGNRPTQIQAREQSLSKITTLRDLGTYVRNDPAIDIWAKNIVGELLKQGVQLKRERFVKGSFYPSGQMDFSVCGSMDIASLYYQLAKVCYRLSFRTKWKHFFPRPEQSSLDFDLGFLPQCFNRGAPYHPSYTAMHAIIYWAMHYLTMMLFDKHHVLPNGGTVESESEQLAANGADGRLAAGVHYGFDNKEVKPLAYELAKLVFDSSF